jgi:hypothetical protein
VSTTFIATFVVWFFVHTVLGAVICARLERSLRTRGGTTDAIRRIRQVANFPAYFVGVALLGGAYFIAKRIMATAPGWPTAAVIGSISAVLSSMVFAGLYVRQIVGRMP